MQAVILNKRVAACCLIMSIYQRSFALFIVSGTTITYYIFDSFAWSFLILKKTEHKTIRHWIVQCLTDKLRGNMSLTLNF